MSRSIRFVNSLAGQPSVDVPIGENVTLGDFLATQDVDTEQGAVRVGRNAQPNSYILQNDDVIFISPKQVKGA